MKTPTLGSKSEEKRSLVKKPSTTAKKKKPTTRDPLKDLNAASGGGGGESSNSSFPPPRGSAEVQKGGCFRFLRSGSSSSKDSACSSFRSLPRTPKSAPPNTRACSAKSTTNPSKLRVCRNAQKEPSLSSRASSENQKQLGSKKMQKPGTPDLLQRWNRRKPTSEKASAGKNSDSELRFEMGLGGNGVQVGVFPSGSCLASTPEKTLQGFSSEVKEEQRKLSITPTSDATPPIEASISPEILNAASIAPTAVCFAAGHVVAGVQDRRKCRPRGILAIGGGVGSEIMEDSGSGFGNGGSNASWVSSVAPPLSGASIHWLSPPSQDANAGSNGSSCSRAQMGCGFNEASVNWLLSRPGDTDEVVHGSGGRKSSALVTKVSSDELWGFSPLNEDSSGLMALYSPGFGTPSSSSGYGGRRTPTSGSSTSPFSAILQRAAASSGLMDHTHHRKKGGHRYSSSVDNSPLSAETLGDGNIMSTPSSYSSSRKQVMLSPFEMVDSMAENLGAMKLSTQPKTTNDASFQFRCPTKPLNSIDRLQYSYRKSTKLCLNKQNSQDSDLRISWREGLASRIFEMDELDHFHWLSDDEGANKQLPKLSFNSDQNNRSSKLQEGSKQLAHGSGSTRFACTEVGAENRDGKVPVSVSCAESISTEGIDGLISSGDSDWTLFYKNHLFEEYIL